ATASLAVVALGRRRLGGIDVLDELDAGALEMPVELLDVALVDVDLGDRGGDLAEGQHSDLLTLGQQVLYLFKFLKLSYKHSWSSRSVLTFCPGRSGSGVASSPRDVSGGDAVGVSLLRLNERTLAGPRTHDTHPIGGLG